MLILSEVHSNTKSLWMKIRFYRFSRAMFSMVVDFFLLIQLIEHNCFLNLGNTLF